DGVHPDVDDDMRRGHGQKPILLAPGLYDPPLVPEIVPLQLLRIGNLIVAGVPAEITTMAGRRLRSDLLNVYKGVPSPRGKRITDVAVAAYANGYSSYITTEEEYELQHYEGASTLYGPKTAKAYRQEFTRLAEAMRDKRRAPSGPKPPDLLGQADKRKLEYPTGSRPAFGPRKFGEITAFPKEAYRRGETVSTTFITADPFIDKKRAETFLSIFKNDGTTTRPRWNRVYTDRDESTIVRWTRYILDSFQLTVFWTIPDDAEPGQYKIEHRGYFMRSRRGHMGSFTNSTPVFEVKA
ncbi:MAG: neutral/alkaline non-lysosomal ceramidase N-terminal domain-containing protein, partial [Chloroflexota bacterium]